MSMTSPDRIELNLAQQQRWGYLIRAGTTAQQSAQRARTVLLAAAGWSNMKIAQRIGVRATWAKFAANLTRRWDKTWMWWPMKFIPV